MTASRYMFAVAATLVAIASGCTQPKNTSRRSQCLAAAIQSQPQLRNGVAVFDDVNGKQSVIAHGNWANLKLRTGLKFSAASLTKPIVAHEIKHLVEAGQLDPDSRIASLLHLNPSGESDPRLAKITVRNLLQHTAGFDRAARADPLWNRENLDYPLGNCAAAADYVLGHPLDFDPGSRVAYSNAGYCVLGKLLESGSWEMDREVRQMLQTPLGAAGGWHSTPSALHARLKLTLPALHLPDPTKNLADGSHYDYAWRHWPTGVSPSWTHFGRLPGLLNIAATDGKGKLVLAYFNGDPTDVDSSSLAAARSTWKCMLIDQ